MNVTDLTGHETMIDHVETMDVMTDVTDDSHLLVTTDQLHQIGVNSPGGTSRVVNHDVWMEVLEVGRIGVEAGYQVRITRTPARGKCGWDRHEHRNDCPVIDQECYGCGKYGHFKRVCYFTTVTGAASQE